MEFYEVLEKRRTYRDFSDREVSDELLKRVIGAAFKAPTNDHLRQLEFIVVRGRENIARIITPLAKHMAAFKDLVFEADDSGDKDKRAMFADALPKQQKMLLDSGLLILPFFRQKQSPLLEPAEQIPHHFPHMDSIDRFHQNLISEFARSLGNGGRGRIQRDHGQGGIVLCHGFPQQVQKTHHRTADKLFFLPDKTKQA